MVLSVKYIIHQKSTDEVAGYLVDASGPSAYNMGYSECLAHFVVALLLAYQDEVKARIIKAVKTWLREYVGCLDRFPMKNHPIKSKFIESYPCESL